MSDLSSKRKAIFETISQKALAAFNRADELGGEARDYVVDKLRDERVVAVRERVRARFDQLRGRGADAHQDAPPAETAPVAATPPASRLTLGDAAIPAQVFGRTSCSWTGRALLLLERDKVEHRFIDLDLPDNAALQAALTATTKQNTVPYVYVRGQFVGGYNALAEIQRLGQLEVAIMTPEERAAANPLLANVVIAARPTSDEVAPAENADPGGEE